MTKKRAKKALWLVTKETNKLIEKLNNVTKESKATLFNKARDLSIKMEKLSRLLPFDTNKIFSSNCYDKLIDLCNELGHQKTLAHFKCEAM